MNLPANIVKNITSYLWECQDCKHCSKYALLIITLFNDLGADLTKTTTSFSSVTTATVVSIYTALILLWKSPRVAVGPVEYAPDLPVCLLLVSPFFAKLFSPSKGYQSIGDIFCLSKPNLSQRTLSLYKKMLCICIEATKCSGCTPTRSPLNLPCLPTESESFLIVLSGIKWKKIINNFNGKNALEWPQLFVQLRFNRLNVSGSLSRRWISQQRKPN